MVAMLESRARPWTHTCAARRDAMPKPVLPTIDGAALVDAFVYWRATGSTRALADLVPHAELAALLRSEGLRKPNHVLTKIQARASVLLLRMNLGETRPKVLAGCIARLHYGKNPPLPTIAKIVESSLSAAILKEARDLRKWILESSSAESHLDRLREALAASPILDIASTILDADDVNEPD